MYIIPSLLLIIITSLFISSLTCINNNIDGGDDHFRGVVFNVNYKFYGRKKVLLDDFKAFDSIRHLHLLAGGAVDLKIGGRLTAMVECQLGDALPFGPNLFWQNAGKCSRVGLYL
nr:hypothetical protein [Tanacetum cinerariifolium]